MKKIILTLCFIIFGNSNLFTMELVCDFEEVYKDGSVQQGFLLLKDKKLRYQYYDPKLYTIIFIDKFLYIVNNRDTKSFQRIEDESILFLEIIKIFNEYPEIKKTYRNDDLLIIIEKSSNNLIKRIGIKSVEASLSLNLINCEFTKIFDKYFKYFPIENYSR